MSSASRWKPCHSKYTADLRLGRQLAYTA